MNLLELLGIKDKPCVICDEHKPIRMYDVELGPMCYECGGFDALAEVMLVRTPGICKPSQANVR